ncbi:hypothetical protein GmHk_20G057546 [Glycine max]|nr:hypothetical protein GmHk_20G057546 [Glycine max]
MTTIQIESDHWVLKRLLQNSLGDLCSVWKAMNNIITLQHTEIKTSFETSTHVVGHVFKVTLYKKLLGMVSRLSFSHQGLSEPEVSITEEMKTISKRFEELDVCGEVTLKSKLSEITYLEQKVTMDKWMNITDMGYVIASRYNVILISLSLQQSMMFFPLISQPPRDCFVHRVICIVHVCDNHFVQVFLRDDCPLLPMALLWSIHCHYQAKQWSTSYISRMQLYTNLIRLTTHFVDLGED